MRRSALLMIALSASVAAAGDPGAFPSDEQAVAARIDALVDAGCAEAGIAVAGPADDAEFLRRASLDLLGTIPTAGEVRAFLADSDPAKRSKLIDRLLARPEHPTRLARLWRDDLVGGVPQRRPFADEHDRLLTNWLRSRFQANDGYDRLAVGLLSAGLLDRDPDTTRRNVGSHVFLAAHDGPSERAARTARVFLGVQIDCAQCHDHPFDRWTQRDFWGLAAVFSQIETDGGMGSALPSPIRDGRANPVLLPDTTEAVPPRLLGAAEPLGAAPGPWRADLAAWITDPANPYFARAAANRLWATAFGYGLVHPVDDFGPHNPPSHPELLDELARDFAAHGYDVRRTLRILTNTRAYGRTSRGTEPIDPRLYARRSPRPLSPDQLLASLRMAAGLTPFGSATPAGQPEPDAAAFLLRLDGSASRVEYRGGIPQALTMMNGVLVASLTDPQRSRLVTAVAESPFFDDAVRIETLFLATLSRPPTSDEAARCRAFLNVATDRHEALADILWALLNGTEFTLNH